MFESKISETGSAVTPKLEVRTNDILTKSRHVISHSPHALLPSTWYKELQVVQTAADEQVRQLVSLHAAVKG